MTIPEAMLWNVLKRRQLGGLKFRKQCPIDSFVVDFYCAEARLIVELDGESHVRRADKDETRQRAIESKGLTVLSLTNDDVIKHLEAVADGILRAAEVNLRNQPQSEDVDGIDDD
jgi:adenine-specific DNA-methyltransferase